MTPKVWVTLEKLPGSAGAASARPANPDKRHKNSVILNMNQFPQRTELRKRRIFAQEFRPVA
jgi:hypothetical protein